MLEPIHWTGGGLILLDQRYLPHSSAYLNCHTPKDVAEGSTVYHHCNTGALATTGCGTALGVVRSAQLKGRLKHVYVGETRPYLQGARLTAFELEHEDIPYTLVCDSAAGTLMQQSKIDAVLVGCDRVAANGDTANKIGTLSLAVLAHYFDVPLYVCMPASTYDSQTPTGEDIKVEERGPEEIRGYQGKNWAPHDAPVYNPAFDVTPAKLVTSWVTDRGTAHSVTELKELMR